MRQFLAQCAAGMTASGLWLRSRLGAVVAVLGRRPAASALVLTVIAVTAFAVAQPAHAQAPDLFSAQGIATVLAGIFEYVENFLGKLLAEITDNVIYVSQYNGFTNSTVVVRGWVIVRDVVNMAFIAMMLYIAFMTMFGREEHPVQSIVKLMMGAVVINFSRTIIGLMIDVSQVVMLTFVNGIKDAAGGNFVELFQIQQVVSPTFPGASGNVGEILGVHLLALTMLTIAIITMVTLLVFLVARIVYLWILTIMSPLAFFGYYSPAKAFQGIWGDWWTQFVKQLKSGPILAFFLWLALLTVQATGGDILENRAAANTSSDVNFLPGGVQVNLQTYVVGIVLILLGMKYALAEGGDSFKFAKKLVDKGVDKAKKYGGKFASKGAGYAWKGTKATVGAGIGLADTATGFRLAQKDAQGRFKFAPTFQGTRVSDLAAMGATKVKDGLGMTKEAHALHAAEDEVAKMKRRGANPQDIQKKEAEIRGKIAADLLRKHTPEKLSELVAAGKLNHHQTEAAVMALAQKGHASLKGQGKGISEYLDHTFHGDVPAGFEMQVREALEKAGDTNAFVGFDKDLGAPANDDLTDKFAFLSAEEAAKELKGVGKGAGLTMYTDAHGKQQRVDRYADARLIALKAETYEDMRKDAKRYGGTMREIGQGLKNSMALAHVEGDTAKVTALTNKMNEFRAGLDADLAGANTDLAAAQAANDNKKIAEAQERIGNINKRIGEYGLAAPTTAELSTLGATMQSKVTGQRLKAMKQGVGFTAAFSGFENTGTPKNVRYFNELATSMVKKDNAIALAKSIDAGTLTERDGQNAAAVALFSNLSDADMQKMAMEGQSDAVIALLQAADGLSNASVQDLTQQYDDEVILKDNSLVVKGNQIATDQARNDAWDAYEDQAKKAVANASLIAAMRDNITKHTSSKLTRTLAEVGNVVGSLPVLAAATAATAAGAAYVLTPAVKAAGVAPVALGLGAGAGTAAGVNAGAKVLARTPGRAIGRATRSISRFFSG
jgi:hypothetical protein